MFLIHHNNIYNLLNIEEKNMDEIKVIAVMNEAMIEVLKEKGKDYSFNLKIKEELKDETFFFRINKDYAYKILYASGVKKEQLDRTYKKLIWPDEYYNLLNKGKIKENDEQIVIKYDKYKHNELFKNKRNS